MMPEGRRIAGCDLEMPGFRNWYCIQKCDIYVYANLRYLPG